MEIHTSPLLTPTKLIFLPGAGGNPEFWQPVADRLVHGASRMLMGWPGFGAVPKNNDVQNMDDLVALVLDEIDQPSALIAQSMGGIIAIQAALKQPELITHLVLTATSGGVNMADLQAQDWRPAFIKANPILPRWFADYNGDITDVLSSVQMPVLLLWGDSDVISPVEVGLRLKGLIAASSMQIIPGGEHDLANKLAHRVAPLIDIHLANML